MRVGGVLVGGALAVVAVAGLLLLWVDAGDDGADDSGVEINYVDSDAGEPPTEDVARAGSIALEGLTVAARRPGNMVELAALATLDGVEIDIAAQEPAIPDLPDIAATAVGLVLVDGMEAVRFDGGARTVTGRADAVVWAGGSLVWHIRNVGDGDLEAVLVDVITGRPRGERVRATIDQVRPAQGLGLIVGDQVVAESTWDLSGFEILAGSSAGVLLTDGESHYVMGGPEADLVEVNLGSDVGTDGFAALSPGLERVIAFDRASAQVVDLTTGEVASLVPAVANPLRYAWLPGGDGVLWMEKGIVYLYEVPSGAIWDLGPATVAISYGSLEVFEDGPWDGAAAEPG